MLPEHGVAKRDNTYGDLFGPSLRCAFDYRCMPDLTAEIRVLPPGR